LYRNDSIDIIVIARGGGDKQGMYMYDDEHLIQKILKRTKCVVSAVGHDEDHPILEYVVDRVCSTPTAVSYIFPDLQAEKEKIKNYCSFLQRKTSEVYNFHKTRLTTLQNKFNTIFNELYTDAKDKLRETEKSIDKYVKLIDNKRLELKHFIPDIKTKILSLIDSKYSQYKNLRDDLVRKNVASIDKRISSLKTLQEDLLRRISSNIDKRVSYLKTLQDDFIRKGKNVLDEKERKIIKLQSEFNVASPEQILENGYAIISKNNKILSSFGSVSPNDTLTIKTKDNIITVVVRDVKDKQ
jgi:exodeoxyribonuclease VII large subunit